MTPIAKFSLRLAIYGGMLAYIAGDLFLFHGPLYHKIDRANPGSQTAITEAKSRGVVARVFNHQITRDQLERGVHERLWLDGKTPDSLTPENLKMVRYAALDELIDHELLRVKSKANVGRLKVVDEEVNERLRRLLGRFANKGEMEKAMKSQGISSEEELRSRIAARIQQEKYVELLIAPMVRVTEDEAKAWHEENRNQLAKPDRVKVRHVFMATNSRTDEEAKALLDTTFAELKRGEKSFDELAREFSEDPETKERGGDLGWVTRRRLPDVFAEAVFGLPLRMPSLIRSRIGWHLIEVTDRMPTEPSDYEGMKDEIHAALAVAKRQQAVAAFRDALRRQEARKIDVYHDMMVW